MRTVIDIDDELLEAAAAELGTATKRDTVNEALRQIAERPKRAKAILENRLFMGGSDLGDPEVMRDAHR
jgi:Arc/MetJ family transcription regulator